jgi:peptidyl-prolyl cis-trans isomerase B (cyclophilin B)
MRTISLHHLCSKRLAAGIAASIRILACAAALCIPFSVAAQKKPAKAPATQSPKAASANTSAAAPTTLTPRHPKYAIAITQAEKMLGSMVIELLPEVAPKHVANFDSLVRTKFYNGTAFHRVVPGFMIQGGDPNSKSKPKETWGMGDPSQKTVPAEFGKLSHTRGMIAAARLGNDVNSATSQFFICHGDAKFLDGQYTIFGRVISGMDVVDSIAKVPCDMNSGGEKALPQEKVEMTITPKAQYVISVTHGGKTLGDITIETLPEVAPKHVAQIDSLVAEKTFDGTAFHRVIPGFMIQGGDLGSKPNGRPKNEWGQGLPGLKTLPAEFSKLSHKRGMVSMARLGNDVNSATTQFFICHGDPTFLDNQYTIWAQVVTGMEIVDKVAAVPCAQGSDGAVSSPVEKVEMQIRKK